MSRVCCSALTCLSEHNLAADLKVLHLRGITLLKGKRDYTLIVGEHHKTYHSTLESALVSLYDHYVKSRSAEATQKTIKDLSDLLVECKNEVVAAIKEKKL